MIVIVVDNYRDRISKIYCDRDIKSDCNSVWDGKKESNRDSNRDNDRNSNYCINRDSNIGFVKVYIR